ncbi:MAG TPA: HAMP domain-containing sensor histidine kinase [Ilumatobacter sp.]
MISRGPPWSRLPLRARVTAMFMLLALASTATVSVVSYGLARRYVLDQRDRLATSQAFSNARLARSLLRAGDPAPELVVDAIRSEAGAQVLLRFDGEWYTSAVALDPGDLPPGMGALVDGGSAARQRFSKDGITNLAVGVPLPAVDAVYYEVSPLVELRRTLGILSTALIVASVVTTLAAAVAGLVVSRRLLRPLHRMSDAAVDIADGELDRRLEEVADSDLEPLVESFNHMADAIQVRIEREARFASDVSHELRTPLTTLATAVELARNRRAEMPERAATAVDLLGAEVEYFERLVLDLLEISRLDAGAEIVEIEEVDLRELLGGIARAYGAPAVFVVDGQRCVVMTDRRRIERIVANLFENAGRYAGGVTHGSGEGPTLDDTPAGPDSACLWSPNTHDCSEAPSASKRRRAAVPDSSSTCRETVDDDHDRHDRPVCAHRRCGARGRPGRRMRGAHRRLGQQHSR